MTNQNSDPIRFQICNNISKGNTTNDSRYVSQVNINTSKFYIDLDDEDFNQWYKQHNKQSRYIFK